MMRLARQALALACVVPVWAVLVWLSAGHYNANSKPGSDDADG